MQALFTSVARSGPFGGPRTTASFCCRRTYLKQYVLRKQHGPEGATLHPNDTLFVVHVHSAKQSGAGRKPSWQAGGALMHSLQVRLSPLDQTTVFTLHICQSR